MGNSGEAGTGADSVPQGTVPAESQGAPSLGERLGYPPDARVVIVTCDDLGLAQAANVATYAALRDGIATSASLMVPAPWAREAAARYRGEDIGVHLTLNAELERYRWGPVTRAPSLLDGDGGFPRTVADLWDHADLDEVRRELRVQIERAIIWGFDVTHLDSHIGSLVGRPEFFDVYLELAIDFGLPIRLSSAPTERTVGFPFRRLAAEEGVMFPDQLVSANGGAGRRALDAALESLAPGVTEIHLAPAVDTPELRAMTDAWSTRVDHRRLLELDSELADALKAAGAHRIGFAALRDLQQGGL